ncbi:MAG: DAK2 domain-containing protein [Geminicoccaceae bacterium]|nr:DAK2 domain-containing protein [Geminicoccaceae bacterium]
MAGVAAETIASRRAELDRLNEAVGDGDHGTNLARGLSDFVSTPVPAGETQVAALRRLAETLRSTTGGTGGAAYAGLFEGMADAATYDSIGPDDLVPMLRAGIERVAREGGIERGQKTLLDVLGPLADRLQHVAPDGVVKRPAGRGGLDDLVVATVAHALHRTTYLERPGHPASVGHIDAGACSAALVIGAVVGALTRRD